MKKPEHLLVVGAGIGGLTAALALAQKGLQVTLIERAAELGEVGAGLQVAANGTHVLEKLGLGTALDELERRDRLADGAEVDAAVHRARATAQAYASDPRVTLRARDALP